MKKKDIIEIFAKTMREEIAFWRTLAQDTQAELNRARDTSLCMYHRGLDSHTIQSVSSCRKCNSWNGTLTITPVQIGIGGTTSANAPYTLTQTTTNPVPETMMSSVDLQRVSAACDAAVALEEAANSVLVQPDPLNTTLGRMVARGKALALESSVREDAEKTRTSSVAAEEILSAKFPKTVRD